MSEETTARRRPSPSRPRPNPADGPAPSPPGADGAAGAPAETRVDGAAGMRSSRWRRGEPEAGPATTGPRHAAVIGRPGVQSLLDGDPPADANGSRNGSADAPVDGGADGTVDGTVRPRWQRFFHRDDADDDEGPFFPPETHQAATPVVGSIAGAAPAGADGVPVADRPRPRPGPGRDSGTDRESGPDGDSGLRPPDISRYLDKPDAPQGDTATEDRRGTERSDGSEAVAAPAASSGDSPDDKSDDKSDDKRSRWRERLAATRSSRTATRLGLTLAIIVISAVVLRIFVMAPYFVPSPSMEPTLHGCTGCSDDHILVEKVSYRFHGPQPGDIVVFSRPKDDPSIPNKTLVKRVVATGGDHVALRDGVLYVNGGRLDENYLDTSCGAHASRPHTGRSRWTVPHHDVFVMGDNRCDSTDSRDFGPIPNSSIQGRAFLIFWPLGRFGLL